MRMPLLASIMVRPRETMRTILDTRGTRGIVLIVVAAFCSSAITEIDLRKVSALSAIDVRTLTIAGVVLLLVGAVVVPLFYALSWLAMWSGRFAGGTGGYAAVRTAVAWGLAPIIWALLYRIPAIFFWPDAAQVFRNNSSSSKRAVPMSEAISVAIQTPTYAAFYQIAILAGLEALLFVIYLVVASNTLAEAQGISSWAGLGNLVLAWVLPFVAGLAIALAAFLSFS